ncbi:MAG: DUF4438 domain-containing protein [Vampirovibrionales bacterium]
MSPAATQSTPTLAINTAQLVALSVLGEIAPPTVSQHYRVEPTGGSPILLPSVGGISYNAGLGDPCVGIAADHVEPGVSIRHPNDKANRALNSFACIGNTATVVSGEAKGATGTVIGTHGGVDHVMVQMAEDVLAQLVIGDRFQIKAYGQGLQLANQPDITVMNMDPGLLARLCHADGERLSCPVTHHIPAHLLGAGLGEETCYSGDVDIQLFDEESVAVYELDTLRFGDVVAMINCDHRYGRIYRKGWVSIGVVCHSCCVQAGHGPGVTTILTGPQSHLITESNREANLQAYI